MVKTGENAYRILLALSGGDRRFNELLKEVKKASLARELTELEKQNYIKRSVQDTKPPTTYYAITERGREFLVTNAVERLRRLELELTRLKSIMPDRVRAIRNNL